MQHTDFSKGLNKVNYKILQRKLRLKGFSDPLYHLISHTSPILKNREQFVEYKGCTSTHYPSTSEVSQGSVSGLFLFLLFIDDTYNQISSSEMLLYVDDLKVYKQIQSLRSCVEL